MAEVLWRFVLTGLLLAISYGLAGAEDSRKVPKIGQLYGTNPSIAKPYDEAFREGLRSLGYIDGKNVILLPRYAQGDPTRFPGLVSELIAADVDVFVVAITAIPAALKATHTIPIVAPTMGGSPVEDGLVASLAHPGGNLTGGCDFGPEQNSKVLQFAMEVVPGVKRVGLMFEATNPELLKEANQVRVPADRLGISLRTYGVRDLDEISSAFARFHKDRLQVLIVWATPLMLLHARSIMEFASHKIPVIGQGRGMAEAGALITFSANFVEMWGRAAVHVDKILKGAKPGDLPIERPTRIETRVNLKTARDLGITIPESILLQADEIIR